MAASLFGSVGVPSALSKRAVDLVEESLHARPYFWLTVEDDVTGVFGLTKNTETQMTTLTRPTLECPELAETLRDIASLYKVQINDNFEFTNVEVCKAIHGMKADYAMVSRAEDPCCVSLMLTLGDFTGGETELIDLRDSSVVRLDMKGKLTLTNTAFPIKVSSFAGIKYTFCFYTSMASLSLFADDMAHALLKNNGFPTAGAAENYEAVCRAANVRSEVLSESISYKSEVKYWISAAERAHNELNVAQNDGDSVTVLMCRLLDLVHKLHEHFPSDISKRPVDANQREAQAVVAEDFVKTLAVATSVLGVCHVHEGAVVPVSRKRSLSSATVAESESDSSF
jgi:hypothetical protein